MQQTPPTPVSLTPFGFMPVSLQPLASQAQSNEAIKAKVVELLDSSIDIQSLSQKLDELYNGYNFMERGDYVKILVSMVMEDSRHKQRDALIQARKNAPGDWLVKSLYTAIFPTKSLTEIVELFGFPFLGTVESFDLSLKKPIKVLKINFTPMNPQELKWMLGVTLAYARVDGVFVIRNLKTLFKIDLKEIQTKNLVKELVAIAQECLQSSDKAIDFNDFSEKFGLDQLEVDTDLLGSIAQSLAFKCPSDYLLNYRMIGLDLTKREHLSLFKENCNTAVAMLCHADDEVINQTLKAIVSRRVQLGDKLFVALLKLFIANDGGQTAQILPKIHDLSEKQRFDILLATAGSPEAASHCKGLIDKLSPPLKLRYIKTAARSDLRILDNKEKYGFDGKDLEVVRALAIHHAYSCPFPGIAEKIQLELKGDVVFNSLVQFVAAAGTRQPVAMTYFLNKFSKEGHSNSVLKQCLRKWLGTSVPNLNPSIPNFELLSLQVIDQGALMGFLSTQLNSPAQKYLELCMALKDKTKSYEQVKQEFDLLSPPEWAIKGFESKAHHHHREGGTRNVLLTIAQFHALMAIDEAGNKPGMEKLFEVIGRKTDPVKMHIITPEVFLASSEGRIAALADALNKKEIYSSFYLLYASVVNYPMSMFGYIDQLIEKYKNKGLKNSEHHYRIIEMFINLRKSDLSTEQLEGVLKKLQERNDLIGSNLVASINTLLLMGREDLLSQCSDLDQINLFVQKAFEEEFDVKLDPKLKPETHSMVSSLGARLKNLPQFRTYVDLLMNGTLNVKRYQDSTAFSHLGVLKNKYPKIFEGWQQARSQSVNGMQVLNTDHPELMLQMGEGLNSCFSSEAITVSSQHFISYFIDGYNRMIAVLDEKGQIMARAVVRIYFDPNESPILFEEVTYSRTDEALGSQRLIREMSKETARALGIPLYIGVNNKFQEGMQPSEVDLERKLGKTPQEMVDVLGGDALNVPYKVSKDKILQVIL